MSDQLNLDDRHGDPASGRRDLKRERAFLTEAAHGEAVFVTHAEARLVAGEQEHGDSWCWVGIKHLLREAMEETVDLACWSALALQALDRETDLSDLHKDQIRSVLVAAARRGAQAHGLLMNAHTSMRERS